MSEVVLKPCPFCGKVPGIEQTESETIHQHDEKFRLQNFSS